MGEKVHGTFTSEKISKLRWKPDNNINSDAIITGSWDNHENHLSLWSYAPRQEEIDFYPRLVEKAVHKGDVTELKFIGNKTFVVSSSSGSVHLYRLNLQDSSSHFKVLNIWDTIHNYSESTPCPCTGLACYEEDIATVGDDGRIVLLTAQQRFPVRTIDNADSCSLSCVCFLKHNEILTANLRGQMKVWDLRIPQDNPSSTFMLSGQQIGATCVAHHPTQRHVVLAGSEDGALTVWDLRQNTVPVTLLSAHSDTVNEIIFHPDRPEHLFSCSSSGELWHWDTTSMTRTSKSGGNLDFSLEENPWLSSDASQHRLEVFTLMQQLYLPINSIDVNSDRVICGCDNEAFYVLRNVIL